MAYQIFDITSATTFVTSNAYLEIWIPGQTTSRKVLVDDMLELATMNVKIADGANLDPFSRLRVSTPQNVHDAQFTYDLQPLLYEQITAQTGATIAHDGTDRCATLAFSSTPAGGQAVMQSHEWFRYQPGKGQLVFTTFNFIETATSVQKFAGYSDGSNGVELLQDGSAISLRILSDSTASDETVAQDDWNLDTMDGSGASGISLNFTKTQILVIDLQALYVGRVRVGFDVNGVVVYAHEFNHANLIADPYIQTASLPIRVGMTCTDTASTTMDFICASVISEGGQEEVSGYGFTQAVTNTAGNGAAAHVISLRPCTTFATTYVNRTKFVLESVDLYVSGNSAVRWELVLGQNLTTVTTFSKVNATYSAFEYNRAGVVTGTPAIVIASGYTTASAQNKTASSTRVPLKYPITLDSAGANRINGTLSVLATGLTAASDVHCALNWREIR